MSPSMTTPFDLKTVYKSDPNIKVGSRVRVKAGWASPRPITDPRNEKNRGTVIAISWNGEHIYLGQDWATILWDGDDDPDVHKLAGLELLPEEKWREWPRPWKQNSLLIEDSQGNEIIHLIDIVARARGLGAERVSPEEAMLLGELIVKAVNAYKVEAE